MTNKVHMRLHSGILGWRVNLADFRAKALELGFTEIAKVKEKKEEKSQKPRLLEALQELTTEHGDIRYMVRQDRGRIYKAQVKLHAGTTYVDLFFVSYEAPHMVNKNGQGGDAIYWVGLDNKVRFTMTVRSGKYEAVAQMAREYIEAVLARPEQVEAQAILKQVRRMLRGDAMGQKDYTLEVEEDMLLRLNELLQWCHPSCYIMWSDCLTSDESES